MFHIGGIAAIIGSPMGGSKILIMRKWDLERALQLAVDEGLTAFGGVPAIALTRCLHLCPTLNNQRTMLHQIVIYRAGQAFNAGFAADDNLQCGLRCHYRVNVCHWQHQHRFWRIDIPVGCVLGINGTADTVGLEICAGSSRLASCPIA